MTFREVCKKHLVDNGLFEDQAEAVLSAIDAEDQESHEAYRTFNRECGGYPMQLRALYIAKANSAAADWIRENMPRHWALPMFDPSALEILDELGVP
jgi:hypothetical protein